MEVASGPGCSPSPWAPRGTTHSTGGQGKAAPWASVQDGLARIWKTAHSSGALQPGLRLSRRKGGFMVDTHLLLHSHQAQQCSSFGLQILEGSSPLRQALPI